MQIASLFDASARALLASYWGKADPACADSGAPHHGVLGHSLDVAACAFVLAEGNAPLVTALSGGARSVTITLAALTALHDIGKLDTRFQRKAPHVADRLRPHTAGIPRGPYDHGTEGFAQIEDDDDARAHLVARLGDGAVALLRAVAGHHGALPARRQPDGSRADLPRSVRREDARARAVFLDVMVAFFVELGAALPLDAPVDGPLVQRVAGLCAIADWVGSNIDSFPYAPEPVDDLAAYWTRARERAERACRDAGLVRLAPAGASFGALFPGYSPRDVQRVTERVDVGGPALVLVEAEMGKGKTEAALSLAAKFLARGAADGLTVALPTMATSNAMFGRVQEVAPRLFLGGPVQLALAHSGARRQRAFAALVQRGLRANDPEAPEASVACARWLLSRKRILLAQVGVGTIDQALQAALSVRHQFVRMFGLARNVVVIDEVHAYDAYMEVLLEHLLAWLGALGVPVILLSATLPSARRAELARAWRSGARGESRDVRGDDDEPLDGLEIACARPYPLVTVVTAGGTRTFAADEPSVSRALLLERSSLAAAPSPSDLAAVAERLVAAASAGARVVWIRNTVREAQQAFRAVAARAGQIEHALFHARFRGGDRRGIEQATLARFGRGAPPGGRVLIATQVVEQSLDLDFDELHTDLAPIDLLFQRAGRLHRHTRARPAGFEAPRLVVHGPSDADVAAMRFGPSAYVYDAGTLYLADRALRPRTALHLPEDIRPLVEEAYHPESRRALLAEGGPRLVEAEARRMDVIEARQTNARRCCIPPTTAESEGEAALPDDDDAVQAFTRDGRSVTLLPFLWDGAGGRLLDDPPDAPAWPLDASRADAFRLVERLHDETLSIPARGEAFGDVGVDEVAAWGEWRRRFARFADETGLGTRVVPLPMRRDGAQFKGWLRMGGKRRRALYSPVLGLVMPSEKDEKEAR